MHGGDSADGCTLADLSCYCRPPGSDAYVACVRGACDAADLQQFVVDTEQFCAPFGGLVTGAASASATPAVVVQASSAAAPSAGTGTVTSVAAGSAADYYPSDGVATTATSSAAALFSPSVVQPAGPVAATTVTIVTQPVFQPATAAASSPEIQSTSAVPVATTGSVTSSTSTNVGAIAGGVVGGVVVILAILVAVWVVLRRRRRQADGVFTVPTEPINALGAGGGGAAAADGAAYAEEGKAEMPEGVDSAPVNSGGKVEGRSTVGVEEVEHPTRF
ncbi:hypothetical protein MMC15_004044 [Xylographa vitiligo]|nr:hypothetical protein [Xylographa vitiligo]